MIYQSNFKRYEIKYLVTLEQKNLLLAAMEPYMEPDEYGRTIICNLYFDTPEYLLARRSMEHPVYKEKLRLRSYGTAREDSRVFIELKKKYRGVVYKRRVAAGQREAMDYLCKNKALRLSDGDSAGEYSYINRQIAQEIDCFRSLYPGLDPAVYLSYEREAFYGRDGSGLRVTFDENILWREENLSLCAKPYGRAILEPGYVLLEVKTAGAMPLWLCRLLSENGIFACGFSKYCSAYRQLVESREAERNNHTGGRKYA